jgi:phosphate transport system substrate-binding protein
VLFTSCARREAVVVAGSTAFQPFAEEIAEEYMQKYPDLNITVQGGGSSVGIQSALNGVAQIGMADLVELPPAADPLIKNVAANDGIVMIVNPANPDTDISLQQIRDVYLGKINNWKELGGADKAITVISREAGSGTRSSFEKLVFEGGNLRQDAIIGDSNGTVREQVANDPNAIGYISNGNVNNRVKPLTLQGVACTVNEITSGKYKLVRPIYLLTTSTVSVQTQKFLDYILGPDGQKTIHDEGLIPAHLYEPKQEKKN